MHLNTRAFQSGFSLIELSLVLVIISLIVGAALSFGPTQNGVMRERQTYEKMSVIEEALIAHLLINGDLPCPADPTHAYRPSSTSFTPDADFGDSDCDTSGSMFNNGSDIDIWVDGTTTFNPGVFVGAVPFVDLGLPQNYMFDAWGNRFTYVVEENFVSEFNVKSFAEGTIRINGVDGTERTDTGRTIDNPDPSQAGIVPEPRGAVYVLISHGANGLGAYPQEGGTQQSAAGASTAEQENLTNHSAKVYAQGPITPSFDDIVRYRSKKNMLFAGGIAVASDLCQTVQYTLMPVKGTNATVAQEGPAGCTQDDGGTAVFNEACAIRQTEFAQRLKEKCLIR